MMSDMLRGVKKNIEAFMKMPESEQKKVMKMLEKGSSDVTIEDDDEAMERYIDEVPDIIVDKYNNFLNTVKEDKELTDRYPDDFEKSVRVLPIEEKDGERFLRMIATDEKKTKDFYDFLKEGDFKFENEIIEGIDREKTKEAIKERLKRSDEK